MELEKLNISNIDFLSRIEKGVLEITPILPQYLIHFPTYTDHSIVHSKKVLEYVLFLLGRTWDLLNDDEKYILIMATYLHDIGMCPSENEKRQIMSDYNLKSDDEFCGIVRDKHHIFSYNFILENWEKLEIPNKKYAEAIGLVAQGHRKNNLFNFDIYNPNFIVKGGVDFVCLPFLAMILRLADELDITNDRTPELYFNKYYPSNKISQTEWDKHKANYFINFKDTTIIITSECDNPQIYYGLCQQKMKIEGVLKELHKLIRLLPTDKKLLSVNYHQVEHNISIEKFIPIDIGFSFDFEKIFEAFIGRNLYKNDWVALRELIQNAIDTCSYKQKLFSEYEPIIYIYFNSKEIIVEDNGMGMDHYIIENYFAKLNSSFYQQEKISSIYNSIGQFGIGVYSYFLLCDYFEVETKSKNSSAIKFRAIKSADVPFYFFDNPTKNTEGTKVYLVLNKAIKMREIIDRIEFFFPYVDIPIVIKDNEGSIYRKTKKSFSIDKEVLIRNFINPLYKGNIESLTVISNKFNNSIGEGNIGIMAVKENDEIKPSKIYRIIEEKYGSYNICQKGIFIQKCRSAFLLYTFGDINLKQKLDLNISRTNFLAHNEIREFIISLEKPIITEMFEGSCDLKTKEEKLKYTIDIFSYYINFNCYNKEIFDVIKKYLIVKIIFENQIEYLTLGEILKLDCFIILNQEYAQSISKNIPTDKEALGFYSKLNHPVIYGNNTDVNEKLLEMFVLNKSHIELLQTDINHYFIIYPTKTLVDYHVFLGHYKAFRFQDSSIVSYPNISVKQYYNSNHPIISFIIENEEKINNHSELRKLFVKLMSLLDREIFDFHLMRPNESNLNRFLHNIRLILNSINQVTDNQFTFSKKIYLCGFPVIFIRK